MKHYKKEFFLGILIFTFYAVLFFACASSGSLSSSSASTSNYKPSRPVSDITYNYESKNPSVSLVVNPTWSSTSYSRGLYSFRCGFTNNSDKIIKIVWAGSTIYYGGSSYLPFIEGQKYIDATSNPMPATVLPKGGYLVKEVYSSEQPYYNNGWDMFFIQERNIQLIFQIDSENGTEYITANVSWHYED